MSSVLFGGTGRHIAANVNYTMYFETLCIWNKHARPDKVARLDCIFERDLAYLTTQSRYQL